jgi:signal transduction histidine kinase
MDMQGEMITRLAHPDDLVVIQNMLVTIIAENSSRTYVFEYRFKDKWDHYHWLRTYIVIFKRDEKGQPTELLGQTFVVSKEKELMLALEKRETELLEAQSIAKVGSFDWNLETDTTDYTPEMRRIFESDSPTGYVNFLANVHEEDRKKVEDAMTKSLKEGYYECEFRFTANNKDKVLWARGSIGYKDEKPFRMIGTVQDVTERKRFEESLFEKTIELQKSNASLQEFASVASHDLKEPLRKIITFSDMVQASEKDKLSPTGAVHLQKVIDSARRMKDLIDDILTFSAMGTKETKEEVSLQDILQDVLSTLEVRIREKEATVTVTDLPAATVYPVQIQQLFLNLLSNALKFSKKDEKPQIVITHSIISGSQVKDLPLGKAASYLQIKVADNGIGFSKEASEKIFQLFHRLHNKTQYEGTGLGLAICRKVAENHGGSIHAESEPGKGSAFIILLPLL